MIKWIKENPVLIILFITTLIEIFIIGLIKDEMFDAIIAIGTIGSACVVGYQAKEMREANALSQKQNEESLKKQTDIALYEQRRKVIENIWQIHRSSISFVQNLYNESYKEVEELFLLQESVDDFFSEQLYSKRIESLNKIRSETPKLKPLQQIIPDIIKLDGESHFKIENLKTESYFLFSTKVTDEISKYFKQLNKDLNEFKKTCHYQYGGLLKEWYSSFRYLMNKLLVLASQNPDIKEINNFINSYIKDYNEELKKYNEMAKLRYKLPSKIDSYLTNPIHTPQNLIKQIEEETKLVNK